MAKLTATFKDGWPVMAPVGKKELQLLDRNIVSGEVILGCVIANFGQVVVATDHKVLVVKTGHMAGQAFGGKATSFDYRNIGAVEVRTGFSQGEMQIINPSLPSSQGNRNKDKVRIAETPNGVVFGKRNAQLFEAFAGKVRERIGSTLSAPAVVAAPTAASESIPAQIQQLADLHTAGVLTEDEFSAKKAELLGRM
jgi:Short C-terminal domain